MPAQCPTSPQCQRRPDPAPQGGCGQRIRVGRCVLGQARGAPILEKGALVHSVQSCASSSSLRPDVSSETATGLYAGAGQISDARQASKLHANWPEMPRDSKSSSPSFDDLQVNVIS